jgi:hypothetical protein
VSGAGLCHYFSPGEDWIPLLIGQLWGLTDNKMSGLLWPTCPIRHQSRISRAPWTGAVTQDSGSSHYARSRWGPTTAALSWISAKAGWRYRP